LIDLSVGERKYKAPIQQLILNPKLYFYWLKYNFINGNKEGISES
jgi:hypothetical protein